MLDVALLVTLVTGVGATTDGEVWMSEEFSAGHTVLSENNERRR